MLERLVLKNLHQRTSQRVKWTSGARVMVNWMLQGWQKFAFRSIHLCKVLDFANWGSHGPPLPLISSSDLSWHTNDTRPASDKIQILHVVIKYEVINDMKYASVNDFQSNTPRGSADSIVTSKMSQDHMFSQISGELVN